jgi:hypothetical protein
MDGKYADENEWMDGCSMNNFRRGLHSFLGGGAKTSLVVYHSELKH